MMQRGVGLWLEGESFGCLRVLRESKERRCGQKVWICHCDKRLGGCGNKVVKVLTANLRSGNTKSCGCLQKERSRKTNRRIGKKSSRQLHTCVCGRTIKGIGYFRHVKHCEDARRAYKENQP